MDINEITKQYDRIAIIGFPKTGKTYLSNQITDGRPVIQTDDYLHIKDFSAQSDAVKTRCELFPKFAVEGMITPRSLRKGLIVDVVVHLLNAPRLPIPPGAITYGRQCEAIFKKWSEENPHIPVIEINQAD